MTSRSYAKEGLVDSHAYIKEGLVEKGGVNPPQSQIPHRPPAPPAMVPQGPQPAAPASSDGQQQQADS
jgi:hypothetical protein